MCIGRIDYLCVDSVDKSFVIRLPADSESFPKFPPFSFELLFRIIRGFEIIGRMFGGH